MNIIIINILVLTKNLYFISFVYLQVVTPLTGSRTYAPNRVIDLRATIADKNIKTFNLQFTAPGGNLDNGQGI